MAVDLWQEWRSALPVGIRSHPGATLDGVNHAVDRIASRQLSLITVTQLREAGLTHRQVMRFHQQGALDRLRPGVYRVAGSPVTWTQTVLAAVLATSADAFASHETAAALWEFRGSDHQRCGLHLSSEARVRLPGVTAHRVGLSAAATTVHRWVPVTSPERTFIDLAGTRSVKALGECLDDALRRRLIDLKRLRRIVEAVGARGRRRVKPIHQLLGERLPGYQPGANDWERDMDRLWDQLGLDPGVRQHRVTVEGHSYVIDRAIPDLKIGAEYHGHEFHHFRSDQDHDAQRAAELSAAGWHIITITAGTRPETMQDAVTRIVNDRRRWLAAS